ncbi:Gfo/Idh/MocA family protein [Galbibacter mesophilus]|uniref:Gfo/Idh/MocA family protein n=1 Tax=Galbibacter mesophilus TaxID=379069 RepID=UPI00191FB55A|nr:Gfo/Idh/MocA family oxidoreductase [Galbibacter mesophilus]MCM5661662.1 Gfo/Idh/MocA family oxidoreductase [Galbibacter mesophilus]
MKKNNPSKSSFLDKNSRRKFIKNCAFTLGAISIIPRHVMGKGFTPPSDKINLGVIGLGKQGHILANNFITHTEAQIVAGSDVWNTKRDGFKMHVKKLYAEKKNLPSYNGIETYLDYQEMLQRKDIDGVIVSTPDHWHKIQSIDAMKAGKDVYCEKPLTNTIDDGIQMTKAVAKYNTVFQTGSMQRSWEIFRKAKEIVETGKLGEIKKVLVNVGDPAVSYNLPEESLPDGIDWNKWCGPAPLLTYNHRIAPKEVSFYPDWRDFTETGGGILSDWGAHMFDIVQWCLHMDNSGPVTYIPPTEKSAVRGLKMKYDNGIEMVHEDFGRGWAVRFIGTEGSMDVSRQFLETTPSTILFPKPVSNPEKYFKDRGNHYQNWLDCMKTRQKTICPVEVGHRTASICNIANIAYDLGRTLEWDPKKEKFIKDKEANKMIKREDREYETL